MTSSLLFIITSDPRISARPAEAVRIAAGLSAWKKVDVALYLRDAAVLILQPEPDRLVDQENFERYLPILRENGRPIYVQQGAVFAVDVEAAYFEEISDARLGVLAAERSHVLRF